MPKKKRGSVMTKETNWNARYKGDGWAGRVLERIYSNKRLSIFGPLALGAAMLLLYWIFSEAPDKMEQLQIQLIASAVMYPGMLLVLGSQLRNPQVKPNFMDFVLILVTVVCGLNALYGIYQLVFHLKGGFVPSYAVCWVLLSAVALIQSRRI